MHDPIVVLLSSYREGELIQGAIRSLLHLDRVADRRPLRLIVFEGPTESGGPLGVGRKTELGTMKEYVSEFYRSEWNTEADKRNAMLAVAREWHRGHNFWILTIDADEILVWAEYLPDWLNSLKPGWPKSDQNIAPLKMTVPGWDDETQHGPATWILPARCVHSSLLHEYETGLLYGKDPSGNRLDFSNYRSETPPVYGEPHFHHRYYLRTGERGKAKYRGASIEQRQRS